MKSVTATIILGLTLVVGCDAASLRTNRDLAPGQVEASKAAACAECKKHEKYIKAGDDCFCHASDIMTTFENDATKKSTSRSKYGSVTTNTGDAALKSGWMWHCRAISASPGVWQKC